MNSPVALSDEFDSELGLEFLDHSEHQMKQNKLASFLGHSQQAVANWLNDREIVGSVVDAPGGRTFYIGPQDDQKMSFHFNPEGVLYGVGVSNSDEPEMGKVYQELGLDWSISEEDISGGNEPDFEAEDNRSFRLIGEGVEYLVTFEKEKCVFLNVRLS